MTTIYGIPNCSTVKKARQWLADQAIDATFHDFKKQGVPGPALAEWVQKAGLDTVLNRKGTTWRGLSDSDKAQADTPQGALALLSANPSLIKRPVLEHNGQLLIGFDESRYREVFDR